MCHVLHNSVFLLLLLKIIHHLELHFLKLSSNTVGLEIVHTILEIIYFFTFKISHNKK